MPLMPHGGIFHPAWSESNRIPAATALTATCMHTRPGVGAVVFDPATGTTSTPVPTTIAADLPCRVQTTRAQQLEQVVGGQLVTSRIYIVEVPWDHSDIRVDDVLTVTASEAPSLVGRALRVADVVATSQQWTQVLRCEDNEG